MGTFPYERVASEIMVIMTRIFVWCFKISVKAIMIVIPFVAGLWAKRKQKVAYKNLPSGTHGTAKFENPAKVGMTDNSDGFIVGLL